MEETLVEGGRDPTPIAYFILLTGGTAIVASAVALLVGFGWGIYLILSGSVSAVALREIYLGIPLVIASYLVAGIVSGVCLWAIQWVRPDPLRYALSGVLVAGAAYGAAGFASVLGYVHLGVNMMDYSSAEEAWRRLVPTTVALALIAGIPGGLFFGYRSPWK